MIARIFLIGTVFVYAVFVFAGVPFEMTSGRLTKFGNRLQFITDSHSLAKLVGASHYTYTPCESRQICLMPLQRHGFTANMPILFEPCEASDFQVLKNCSQLDLRLGLTTHDWIVGSIKK